MKLDNEYRLKAEEALLKADRAVNTRDRASWLWLAHAWLTLLPERPLTAEEEFEAESDLLGTGQPVSDTSH